MMRGTDVLTVVAFTFCAGVNVSCCWIITDLTDRLREERDRTWKMVEMVGNATQAVSGSNRLMLKMAEHSGLKVKVTP